MNQNLKHKYVEIHKQGWMPIFVNDRLDAVELAGICVAAGFKAVEITCRRSRVIEEIKSVKMNYPELLVLVGSVVDDGVLLPFLKSRQKDFPSIEQLAAAGADGFVALLPFSEATLRKYSRDYLLIPGVETYSEAVTALNAGAHFVKFCYKSPERIAQLNSAPVHGLFPIFYTGGVSIESIGAYVQAGAALLGGGWDLMLKGIYEQLQNESDIVVMQQRLQSFKQELDRARFEHGAHSERLLSSDTDEYLAALTQYHPFYKESVV
ncbi:bifunctional 4-hydroxy-2-oxoglutarate aldolase/2-dehydro-3-deoxy-phosphogluconate aldolase [Paenibacillus koleovorans]|uniref:bifunctional 4-hydroxy-2-oxoglutarate aldolase/2-dehydro-3-deoxy-phosphogluconate aldolase n=1 Tax=Paenibacillus koleovorans TaxID=121608 RepID=UPI000FDAA0D2|nr:bifunctional 4-hydroxy-2-oxoglutarate aldolase/2-dehydro-3-deoxy-phosphogluconate aldolase [Paenibacillus koleovorans]